MERIKAFNLHDALSGKKVVTDKFDEVSDLIVWDISDRKQSVVCCINGKIACFDTNGVLLGSREGYSFSHLLMSEKEVLTGWVNIYRVREPYCNPYYRPGTSVYETEDMASSQNIADMPEDYPDARYSYIGASKVSL